MKDCLAKEQASNSGLSKQQMKKHCEDELNSKSPRG
jgi:hypothetical protein